MVVSSCAGGSAVDLTLELEDAMSDPTNCRFRLFFFGLTKDTRTAFAMRFEDVSPDRQGRIGGR